MKKLLIILSALLFLAGCKTESTGNDNDDIFVPHEPSDFVGTYKSGEDDFTISFDGNGLMEIINPPFITTNCNSKYGKISKFYVKSYFSFWKEDGTENIKFFITDPGGLCDLTTYVDDIETNNYNNVNIDLNLILYVIYTKKSITIKKTEFRINQLKYGSHTLNKSLFDNTGINNQNEIILNRQD